MGEINVKPEGDHLVRATALNGQVRLAAVRSSDTVRRARDIHDLSPLSAAALGRFRTGLQLMAADLKNKDDQITGIIRSDGPLKGMTAVASADRTVRGFVLRPDLPDYRNAKGKFDLARAVGNGVLTVIKAQAGARPYSGSVPLISGEIAEDLTYYLATSEQIPTIMGLGVLCDPEGVRHAGGYLIQTLPGAGEDVLDYLEKRAAGFPDLTFLLNEGFSPAQILDLFAGDPAIQYLATEKTAYGCPCSRERMAAALMTLSPEDLAELEADENGAELCCDFCRSRYHFSSAELSEMAAAARRSRSGNEENEG